jgi:hypothetical protein
MPVNFPVVKTRPCSDLGYAEQMKGKSTSRYAILRPSKVAICACQEKLPQPNSILEQKVTAGTVQIPVADTMYFRVE